MGFKEGLKRDLRHFAGRKHNQIDTLTSVLRMIEHGAREIERDKGLRERCRRIRARRGERKEYDLFLYTISIAPKERRKEFIQLFYDNRLGKLDESAIDILVTTPKESVEDNLKTMRLYSDRSLGTKQLVNLRNTRNQASGNAMYQTDDTHDDILPYLKALEEVFAGHPTFGAEFAIPARLEDVVLKMHNISAGKSEIRESLVYGNVTELRINPSYFPIVKYLIDELWEGGILPKDFLISYSLTLSGSNVRERAALLALANLSIGSTLSFGLEDRKINPVPSDTLVAPMLHFYEGATVDIITGKLSATQLVLYVGTTTRRTGDNLENHFLQQLKNDYTERLYATAALLALSKEEYSQCEREICDVGGIDDARLRELKKKLREAENEKNRIDLVGIITPESAEKVKPTVKKYTAQGLKIIGEKTGMVHEGVFALPSKIECGLDWMIAQAYSGEPEVAQRGARLLMLAGGAKAEKVLRAIGYKE